MTACAVVGLVCLLSLCTLCVSESAAMDIAILQSSDIRGVSRGHCRLEGHRPDWSDLYRI